MSTVIKRGRWKDNNPNWRTQSKGSEVRILRKSELTGLWVDVQKQKEATERYLALEAEKRDLLARLNMIPVTDPSRKKLCRRYLTKVRLQNQPCTAIGNEKLLKETETRSPSRMATRFGAKIQPFS